MRVLDKFNAVLIIILIASSFLFAGCSKEGRIEGKIVDNFKQPVKGVDVAIEGLEYKSITDEAGEYSIPYLPGKFTIRYSKAGYESKSLEMNVAIKEVVPAKKVHMFKRPPHHGLWIKGRKDYQQLESANVKPVRSSGGTKGCLAISGPLNPAAYPLDVLSYHPTCSYFIYVLSGDSKMPLRIPSACGISSRAYLDKNKVDCYFKDGQKSNYVMSSSYSKKLFLAVVPVHGPINQQFIPNSQCGAYIIALGLSGEGQSQTKGKTSEGKTGHGIQPLKYQRSEIIPCAELRELKMATAVDFTTHAPTEVVSKVPTISGPLYATAKAKGPPGTKVKAVLLLLAGNGRQIVQDEITLKEPAYVSFRVHPPKGGWLAGKYEVVFYMGGNEAGRVGFRVFQEKAPEQKQTKGQTPPNVPNKSTGSKASNKLKATAPPACKVTTEPRCKFTFKVPSGWSARLAEGDYCRVSAPAGSPADEVSLVIKIKDKNKEWATPAEQMDQLKARALKHPRARILGEGEVPMAGQQATYFLATYRAKDSSGRLVGFGHAQVCLERGNYLYLVSYSAPRDIYQANMAAFQRVINSWKFSE